MTMHKQGHKRSPAKYGTRDKLITSAAALLALLGGYSAIGGWKDTAQAIAASPGTGATVRVQSQASAELLTLESLGIAPMATLPPLPPSLAQATAQPAAGVTAPPLPDLPELQALPGLQPLPELPPPPPSGRTGTVSGGS